MERQLTLLSIIAGALTFSTPATAQSPVPFSTTVRNYTYIGKPGLNATQSPVSLYISSGPGTAGGGFTTGTPLTYTNGAAQGINGAGISGVDGFIYGIEYLYAGPASSSAYFYRIGANAVAERIGTIAPPTGTDAGRSVQFTFVNAAAGTVDAAGNYWFTAYTLTDLIPPFSGGKVDAFIGKISNVALLSAGTAPVTPVYYHLDVSHPVLQTGYANFMSSAFAMVANNQPYTNVNGGWQDMDINPVDGKFYTYLAFPSTPTPVTSPYPEPPLASYLVRIDPSTTPGYWGVATPVNTVPNMNPDREEDGAYFDASGNFYVVFTDGQYGTVATANGALSTLVTTSLPLLATEMRGDFATNAPVTPLPVTLISFTGTWREHAAQLQWRVADATELRRLQIERSIDGRSYTTVHNAHSGAASGTFSDPAMPETAWYRLRMEDIDGVTSYSPLIKISREGAPAGVSIWPNPVTDVLNIGSAAAATQVTIHHADGKTILAQRFENGGGSIAVQLSQIPPGSYLVSVRDAGDQRLLWSGQITKK